MEYHWWRSMWFKVTCDAFGFPTVITGVAFIIHNYEIFIPFDLGSLCVY